MSFSPIYFCESEFLHVHNEYPLNCFEFYDFAHFQKQQQKYRWFCSLVSILHCIFLWALCCTYWMIWSNSFRMHFTSSSSVQHSKHNISLFIVLCLHVEWRCLFFLLLNSLANYYPIQLKLIISFGIFIVSTDCWLNEWWKHNKVSNEVFFSNCCSSYVRQIKKISCIRARYSRSQLRSWQQMATHEQMYLQTVILISPWLYRHKNGCVGTSVICFAWVKFWLCTR